MDLSEIPETSLMGFIQTFFQTLRFIYGECFYFPLVITCISYLLNRGGGLSRKDSFSITFHLLNVQVASTL